MTLGDGKRRVLMLLDEYSSGGALTVDADVMAKMNDCFDAAQKDMALYRPVRRRATLALSGGGADALPPDVARVSRVTKDGKRTDAYEAIDGKLVYAVGDTSVLTLDYLARPATIAPETPDDYEFEVGEEAANCLPFFVAAQQLIPDLVADYGAFYNLYLQMRSALGRSGETAQGGRVRQSLYGRG